MIVGGSKKEVIKNIQSAVENGRFNDKVEVGDPVLSASEKRELVLSHLTETHSFKYKVNNRLARTAMHLFARRLNRTTTYQGIEKIKNIHSGAIVTSNHFNPLENLTVQEAMRRAGKKRLYVVSQDTNLQMSGLVGYLMNYFDTIPLTQDRAYLNTTFPHLIGDLLQKKQFILIYPEQEMWFNYRKPRPGKRGAYYYAAKAKVPIISCFVEMIETALPEKRNTEFNQVRYVLHVLDPIFPDAGKTIHENSQMMMKKDDEQKKEAYEAAYGKPLDYQFSLDDIAGWKAR